MKKIFYVLIVLISIAFSGIIAQVVNQEIYYKIHKIKENIYVAIPKHKVLILSNKLIIKSNGFFTIIDAPGSNIVAKSFINQIQNEIAKLPIKNVILTHNHNDHSFGLAPILSMFPDLQIFATIETAEKLKHGKFLEKKHLISLMNSFTDTNEINEYRKWIEDGSECEQQIVRPNRLIKEKTMKLNFDGTEIIVYNLKGHSTSDLVIYLSKDKIIATGDLVSGTSSKFSDAKKWLSSEELIKNLDYKWIIRGHGEIISENN